MNDDFEQEIIEEEISGEEPLISHNHSNNNSYVNRNANRNNYGAGNNNNRRQNRGNNLNQRRNTSNNNPLTRNKKASNVNGNKTNSRTGTNNGLKNALENRRKKSNGVNRNGNNSRSSESNNEFNGINEKKSNNFKNAANDLIDSSNSESNGIIKIKIPLALKLKIIMWVAIIAAIILVILFIVGFFMAWVGSGISSTQKIELVEDNYCKEFEVTFCSKESTKDNCIPDEEVVETGIGTYDLETYIAGVVMGEVGHFQNEEALKALAVAARTFVLHQTKGSSDCKINSWSLFQVMNPNPNSRSIQAAKDTAGEVMYDVDGNLINSQYDAFACYEKDDFNYRIKQHDLLIPVDWAKNAGVPEQWTSCIIEELPAHGNGMSQYGALYLAETQDFSYQEILMYYYGHLMKAFYCHYELDEESYNPEDPNSKPEYKKVCEDVDHGNEE